MRKSLLDKSIAVCVVGPGRAGTSATMRVLNLLGVDVGPAEGLVEPGPGGPKGFWERYELIRLNDRLLRMHGGSWRNPPTLPAGWERAEELADQRRRARRLLADCFGGSELWGWKDPRVSLTTAFWRGLVPDLRFVVCLRNPVDVANSLSPSGRRSDEPFYYARRAPKWERALTLWMAYVSSALENTRGCRRLLAFYDDYFEDRRAAVERLARFVEVEAPAPGSAAERAIDEFLDPALRHHRTAAEQVLRDRRVPAEVAGLYAEIESLRGTPLSV